MNLLVNNFLNREFNKKVFYGQFGLERENLRITSDGYISQIKHPFGKNKYVDRDFCESQLELISPVCNSTSELYSCVEKIDSDIKFCLNNMKEKEYIWPFSNPPYISSSKGIPIADYEEESKAKKIYRQYLSKKYGDKKMIYCGIHFNYSYSNEFLEEEFRKSKFDNLQKFKNKLYLELSKKLEHLSWLLVYLTSASPVFDGSLLDDKQLGKSIFIGEASRRNGVNGFWNNFIPIIDYNDIESYVESIKINIRKKLLYSCTEFYKPVRIKCKGLNSLDRLKSNGVDHIEIRVFDINPFSKLGIFKEDLDFIHYFIIYLTYKDSIVFKEREQINALANHKKASLFDVSKLYLNNNGKDITLSEWAIDILNDMEKFFINTTKLDAIKIINKMKQRVYDPCTRYSYKIYECFGTDYVKNGIKLSKEYSK